jgi:hypothetical protein
MEGLADAEPLLVSLCLFEALRDGSGNPVSERNVPLVTVKSWPNRVQKRLFDWVREKSDLNPAETKESLRKQIAEAQKRLRELEEADGESDPTTPSPRSGTAG